MPPKKVLFLIPSLDPGGIETYLLRFLRFADKNVDATVVIRHTVKGALYEQYQALNVPLHFMPLGYGTPGRIKQYRSFFKQHQFDVVCDLNANFAGIPLWIARKAGVNNRIAFYRQASDHFGKSPVKKLYNSYVNKLVYKNATNILSNSEAALNYFFPYRSKDDKRFQVIYNGVDAKQFNQSINRQELRKSLGIPEGAIVVGHSGRLDKAKNHATILQVAAQLIPKHQSLYFLFCGKNTEQLKAQAETMGISDKVIALGYRSDVPQLLKCMDLFYFPSVTEGQPNALIEAIIAGLPFVASDIDAIKEMLPNEMHSELVSPMDVQAATTKLTEKIKLAEQGSLSSNNIFAWAAEYFDPATRFNQFLSIINTSNK